MGGISPYYNDERKRARERESAVCGWTSGDKLAAMAGGLRDVIKTGCIDFNGFFFIYLPCLGSGETTPELFMAAVAGALCFRPASSNGVG